MKRIIFLLLLTLSFSAKAQYFNNVNSELCYQLYETSDPLSGYRVYVVVDPENFEEKDYKILEQWNTLDQSQRSKVTQRWSLEGKRIESERAPYITYPPVFPNNNFFVPQHTKKVEQDWGPWKGAKKYWAYADRPF